LFADVSRLTQSGIGCQKKSAKKILWIMTKQEIKTEIEALKKLKPIGQFKGKTAKTIERAIDELEGRGFDTTCGEFDELPDNERDMSEPGCYALVSCVALTQPGR
jgi:hypothetical protein